MMECSNNRCLNLFGCRQLPADRRSTIWPFTLRVGPNSHHLKWARPFHESPCLETP